VRLPLCAFCIVAAAVAGANVLVVLSINRRCQQRPFNYASQLWAQKLDWNKWFAISAAVAEPSTATA
jgi:hypothetical protein